MSTPITHEIIPASVKPRIVKDSSVPEGPWHVIGGSQDAHMAAYDFACALNALGR